MNTRLSRENFVLIAHLQATWIRACRENVDPRLAVAKEERSFSVIRQFDPTGGKYHAWISSWRRHLWDQRGFQVPVDMGELDEVHRALAWFDGIRHRLPPARRDIGQYRTAHDLRSATPSHMADSRRRLEAEALKKEAHSQSNILYEQGRWMVVQLNGYTAARFWGLGTRWCTTMSEWTFIQYAEGGELLVFLTPHGKYQLSTRNQVFRDERDGPVAEGAFTAAPAEFLSLLRRFRGRGGE